MTTQEAPCRGCGNPVTPGYRWHRDCLNAYRRSADYRTRTLARDGYACARCPDAWNRAVLADATTGRLRVTGRCRRVDVDHVVPIGGDGTHDPQNTQVLCKRHHRAKTRLDLARLKGYRPPASALSTARLAAAALALVVLAELADTAEFAAAVRTDPLTAPAALLGSVAGPLLALAAAGAAAAALGRWRRAVLRRLHLALAEVTAESVTARRRIRVRRWGWVGTGPLWRRRLRPTDFTLRYPRTFAATPAQREALEDLVRTKLGWSSLRGTWTCERDRVRLRTPDPFVVAAPLRVPWLRDAAPRTLWDPISIGVDEAGEPVSISLVERNLLMGGEPGAGKSNVLSLLVAAAALDPDVELHLIDGKRVEFSWWKDAADAVAHTPAEAISMLADLVAVMDARYELLELDGVRKIARDDGLGLIVVAVDELHSFTCTDRKTAETFVELARDLVSRGRAAGIIVIAATQRPSADVVPTKLRGIFGFRLALRCPDSTSSDMILAQGWAAKGFSAGLIDPSARGTGYLLGEGGRPRLMRSYLVDDADLTTLVAQAVAVRSGLRSQPSPQGAGVVGGE